MNKQIKKEGFQKENKELPSINLLSELIKQAKEAHKTVTQKVTDAGKKMATITKIERKINEISNKIKMMRSFMNTGEALLSKSKNYELLIKEGIITKEYAIQLQKLEEEIKRLEETREFLNIQGQTSLLETLKQTRNGIYESIKETLRRRQNEIKSRIERYSAALDTLNRYKKTLEESPEVRILLEQEKKETIEESYSIFQSIKDRHENAFKRLTELLGIQNIREYLSEALRNTKKLNEIREKLVRKALTGELTSLSEIIPWYMQSKYHHGEGLKFLNQENIKNLLNESKETNSKAKIILERLPEINRETKLLNRLFTPLFIKELSEAIETGRKVKKILKEGGIITKDEKGLPLAIKSEIRVSTKGNPYLYVEDVAGLSRRISKGAGYKIERQTKGGRVRYITNLPDFVKMDIETWLNELENREIIEKIMK